jgi:Beta-lactamase superfamily domain
LENPIKTIAIILVTLYLLFVSWQHDLGAQEGVQQPPQGSMVLKWLGNAGWEIQIGQTIILIDPFLSRGEANPNAEWKTDEAAVLRVIKRADYIFAGHSHADHIADVPFIAKKFGSKVIGSRTTTNIALTGGVDKSQLVTIGRDTITVHYQPGGNRSLDLDVFLEREKNLKLEVERLGKSPNPEGH